MNLLFFYRIYPNYGGVEVVTTVLANQFVKDGHNVTIVSIEQPHPELLKDLDDRIELEKLDYPVVSLHNIKKLHYIISKKNIDFLINQWGLPFKTTILCKYAIKGTSCSLISVLHGSPYTSKTIIKTRDRINQSTSRLKRFFHILELKFKETVIKTGIRYNCANCKRYVLLSPGFIQPLIDYAGIKKTDNIISIGNPITIPVDLSDFNLDNKKQQILYVGRMDYENKRVNRIIELWEKIYNKYKDWELIMVGDGPYKRVLMEYVANNNIERVHFKGFQVDPPIQYYKEASIFILTSDLEGFGLVIIESMSYGVVPVVYGSYEAVYDIVANNISGFITNKPYSENKMIACISSLIEDSGKRYGMAIRAMSDAKKFSIDSIIKQWYSLFSEIC